MLQQFRPAANFCTTIKLAHSIFHQRMTAKPSHPTDGSNSTTILGVKLSEYSRPMQLLFCCTGIFIGFLINGICEEYVFRQMQFSYAWYFTLVQSSIYVLLAYMQGGCQAKMTAPWRTYLLLSFVWVGSVGLTKASLRYINYPAQIMFKSSKVIPVMIMGAFIPGVRRTYSPHEYFAAIALVVGLIIFTLADISVTPTFEMTGLIMIIGALVFDAFLGNIQEALFVSFPSISQDEVLLCTNLMSIPLLLVPLVATGEVWHAWQSGLEYPQVYMIIGAAAVATYVGQLAILALIALFGAATAYLVTSLRKAFTLCLSYLIFTKPFKSDHLLGLVLIFISLSTKMFYKPQKRGTSSKGVSGPFNTNATERELFEVSSSASEDLETGSLLKEESIFKDSAH